MTFAKHITITNIFIRKTQCLYFILLFVLSPFFSFSQNLVGKITGKVYDEYGSPLSSVAVKLIKSKKVTTTNAEGTFSFYALPLKADTLEIHYIPAFIFKIQILPLDGGMLNLGTLTLRYKTEELSTVEVKGRVPLTYKSDYTFLGTKTQTSLKDVPQSISTVTKELIADKMQYSLKDIATDIAGVNQYSGFDEYTIRGFRAENARSINGLRGYNSTYTSPMLVNIERVEVLKGPAGTLYGNSDPGGSINLVTKKPLKTNRGDVSITGGTWDHFRVLADITGPVTKDEELLYRFNAGYDNTKSFRNSFFSKSYELAPSISYFPNDKLKFNIDFSFSHINTLLDRGTPGFEDDATLKTTPISLMVNQPGDYLKETDIATNISASYKINKNISFNSGYLNYISRQNVAEHGFQSYITPDSINLYYTDWTYNTATNSLTNYFNFNFNTGKLKHQLLVGYDYIKSTVNIKQNNYELPNQFGLGNGIVGTFSLSNPQYPQPQKGNYQLSDSDGGVNEVDAEVYATQGVYVQEQLTYGKWKLLAGLRREFYEGGSDESVWLPKIGLTYTLSPQISIYGTYNRGFDPFEASGSLQFFDKPFIPIVSNLLEAGAKTTLFKDRLAATVALYQLTVQNVATNANIPSNPNLYVQNGEDRARGVETEISGNILPNFSVSVTYAYNVTKINKSDVPSQVGIIKDNAPQHSSNSWLKYTFTNGTLHNLSILIGHSQVSSRNTLDADITLPGYIIFNGGLQYKYKHIGFSINLNNITNKTYWASAYGSVNKWAGAPQNFMAGLWYHFDQK
ncbi:iron complex outermembrane recepter protein [Mucilaginibacter sp. OK268]|nr:iron complex outermembrane recepter protein [Mucilaginibacter sp. OK268]